MSEIDDIPTMPNGSEIIENERIARLKRMAERLRRDLMVTEGIGPEMRYAALERVERWTAEASRSGGTAESRS